MRIGKAIILSSIAILAIVTSPALAKNSDAQKGEDKAASSSCSAYQQAADGSWEQLPCKETGERAQPQTQHKPATQGAEQGER